MSEKDLTKVTALNEENASLQKQLLEMELAVKKAMLEDLDLQKRERQLNMQDVRARIDDREMKQKQALADRAAQGRTFAQQAQADRIRQSMCTHKKGGVVSARNMQALSTGGNGNQYSVIKHQMINGDIWVRCQRCAKTWNPPLKKDFFFRTDETGRKISVAPQDGTFDEVAFKQAVVEYETAKQFNTNNTMSGSVQCRFTKWVKAANGEWIEADATDDYRQSLRGTNLR